MKDIRFRKFSIRVGIQGFGVFATKNFKKGQILFKMSGKVYPVPSRTSVQIGKNRHIEDIIAGHMNHLCHPSAKVYKRTQSFVAARNIKAGEEITFNYNKNEDHLAEPFICVCCQRYILGRKAKRPIKISITKGVAVQTS
jgi:SET domain